MAILLVVLSLVFPALAVTGAVHDAATMKIPNWISIALGLLFVPVAMVAGMSGHDILIGVGLGFAALVVGIALFAFRILGGGDAKLLAASVMWVGVGGLLEFLIYTALAGGALSVGLILARKWVPLMPIVVGPLWLQRLLEPKGDIPYGIAIAVGAICAYPATFVARSVGMA